MFDVYGLLYRVLAPDDPRARVGVFEGLLSVFVKAHVLPCRIHELDVKRQNLVSFQGNYIAGEPIEKTYPAHNIALQFLSCFESE
jgi:hypothetical protein